jgi:hypothetical protein
MEPITVPPALLIAIDHLILGIADLDAGISQFEQRTGVRPVRGGDHPGRGTRNALAALGDGRYLEIMAARRDAPASADVDALRRLRALTPFGWAVSTSDVKATTRFLTQAGYGVSEPAPGSRVKPDGGKLEWVTFHVASPQLASAPFFIRWGSQSVHPSSDSPAGCSLASVRLETAEDDPTRRLLELLALGADIGKGAEARLQFGLRCPTGLVIFGAE